MGYHFQVWTIFIFNIMVSISLSDASLRVQTCVLVFRFFRYLSRPGRVNEKTAQVSREGRVE